MTAAPATIGRRELGAVAALTAGALALRLWRLDAVPPGLHVDEAYNLLDAQAIVAGWRPVFLPANAGREALMAYLQAPFVAAWGTTPLAARVPAALAGALTVPATWYLARGLPIPNVRRVAGLGALLAAGVFWGLHFSRFGIRAVLLAPLAALTLSLWGRLAGADRPARLETFALGSVLGVAAYAHPAGRGLALAPAFAALLRPAGERETALRRLAASGLVALVVALPLVVFWIGHPWLFAGHAEEVSAAAGGAGAFAHGAAAVAGMFNLAGDSSPWRNLPGRPVFDPATGLAFLVGVVAAIASARRREAWGSLLLLGLGALVAPSALSVEAPNFSRAIGALPIACVLAAVGASRMLEGIERLSDRRSGALGMAVLVAWGAGVAAVSARDYFFEWAEQRETPLAFDADKVALGRAVLAAERGGAQAYLSETMAEHPTVRVTTSGAARGFDPGSGVVWPPAGKAAEYIYLEGEPALASVQAPAFRPIAAGLAATGPYSATAQAWPAAPVPARRILSSLIKPPNVPRLGVIGNASWQGRIELEAWNTGRDSGGAYVELVWRPEAPVAQRWTTFVQLVDDQGKLVLSGDSEPLGGTYPTTEWRIGERIQSIHRLTVVGAGPNRGAVERARLLIIGWYDWRTRERLRLTGAGTWSLLQDGTALGLPFAP